ncbi:TPA: hypothetical protein N0F65_002979 [Lagenidium giganteum]|uniref:Tc3 transposase DNA binding domain-containing protein n=1 Tax=Lagenidium giganteum TaxID=4803 RepID=A0AAV2YLW5_9STRA|nr:TPA: hypothetical protein N0F65_002979 [Lagenidium giganteum]
MPLGTTLTPLERDQILALRGTGASAREIAKQLSRSKTAVLNFLKHPEQYATTKRSGRRRSLAPEQEARLRLALTDNPELGSKSAEDIKREFALPLGVRRIQQLLAAWRSEARRARDVARLEPRWNIDDGAKASEDGDPAMGLLPPQILLLPDSSFVLPTQGLLSAPTTDSRADADADASAAMQLAIDEGHDADLFLSADQPRRGDVRNSLDDVESCCSDDAGSIVNDGPTEAYL